MGSISIGYRLIKNTPRSASRGVFVGLVKPGNDPGLTVTAWVWRRLPLR